MLKTLIFIVLFHFQTQKHPEYKGPALGPKMATENKRNFTEEEIRRLRDADIGLQVSIWDQQKKARPFYNNSIFFYSLVKWSSFLEQWP